MLHGFPLRWIQPLEELFGPLAGAFGAFPGTLGRGDRGVDSIRVGTLGVVPARTAQPDGNGRGKRSGGELEKTRHDGYHATRNGRQPPASGRARRCRRSVLLWCAGASCGLLPTMTSREFFYGYRIPVPVRG